MKESTVVPLGSTVTTTSGTAGTQERYHAYGALRSTTAITATDFKYTGQYSDTVSGLIYMNARYYDPTIGQFISPDTIVPDPSDLFDYNRYMYVRGNPLKYSDPSGHCTVGADGNIVTDENGGVDSQTCTREMFIRLTWQQQFMWLSLVAGVDRRLEDLREGFGNFLQFNVLPKTGAQARGFNGSIGMGLDITWNISMVYMDEHGNIGLFGGGIGLGGNTGANVDVGVFDSIMPYASSIDIYEGWSVNTGLAIGEVIGGSAEVNVVSDPLTGDATFGITASAGLSAKVNIPVPFLEFYGNADRTWMSPLKFNIYDYIGVPRR